MEDFAILRLFADRLISNISFNESESRLAILTFHRDCSVISSFSSDAIALSNSLEGYKRMTGSNLVAGLEESGRLFQTTLNDTDKLVIVVTDGEADTNPSRAANLLRNSGVEIMALGVGIGVSMNSLSKFGSYQSIFHFSTFKDLLDFIPPIIEAKEEIKVIPMNTDKIRISIKDNLTIEFIVKNNGKNPLPPLDIRFTPPQMNDKQRYFCDSNAFIQRSIEPGDSEMITVTFPYGGAHFLDVPNEIPFKVFDLNTRQQIYCSSNSFPLSSEWFTKKFIDYKTPDEEMAPSLNILLFGKGGAGKTSFINSILTSLLPHYCNLANIDRGRHVESNLICFPISKNVDQLEKCNINLWDTICNESDFRIEFLSEILKGNVPNGCCLFETINGRDEYLSTSLFKKQEHRKMHAVLLFVSIGILEDLPMCKRLKDIIREVHIYEIAMEIVITVDLIADTNHDQIQSQFADRFHIPVNKVHLVENYHNDYRDNCTTPKKNFLQDKVALNIFNIVVHEAERKIKVHKPMFEYPFPPPFPFPPSLSYFSSSPSPFPFPPPSSLPSLSSYSSSPPSPLKTLLVKRNDDVIMRLHSVNYDQSIDQFERSFAFQLRGHSLNPRHQILQKTSGDIYLRDFVTREGDDDVVYINTSPQ